MSDTSRNWDRLLVTGGGLLGRPPAENDLLGEKVGAFEVVDVIGRGGMSTVYLGERSDKSFEQQVAIKVLESTSSRIAASGFQRERQILARLDHPSIARIFDGGTLADQRPWFAMEYVAGDPIDEHCRRVGADLDTRVRLIERLTEALAAAHGSGVVHNDLKPENILIDRHGHPKLLDFGIARLLSDEDSDPLALMTPRFAAPEQFANRPAGGATDIYQLGLVLYLLATEQHAAGDARDTEELRERSEHLPITPASRTAGPFRGRLDREFDRIVTRCLAPDPTGRYASPRGLLDDLRAWRQGRSTSVGSRWHLPRRWWRHRRTAVLGALVALVVLTVSAWFAWQRIERERVRSEAMSELVSNVLTDAPGAADRITASSFELSGGAVADDPALERELTRLTGEALLRENRASEAAVMLEQVLARSRGGFEEHTLVANAPLYSLLGETYRRLDRLDDAGRQLDLAADVLAGGDDRRPWVRALERRAAVHVQRGDIGHAQRDLEAAHSGLNPSAHSSLAARLGAELEVLSRLSAQGCPAETMAIEGTPVADAIARRCAAEPHDR